MQVPLRPLIVEDDPDDAALLLRVLRKAGYDPDHVRVETPEALREALREEWDIVLSDYSLPRLDAPEALRIVKSSGEDLPFIIVSGTVGEETAVAAMRAGADDYLMKDKLARLGPAIQRELDEAAGRRARRRAEADLARRDRLLRAVVSASERLLRGDDWVNATEEALAWIGRAMEVQRVFLFRNEAGDDGEVVATPVVEWSEEGVESLRDSPELQAVHMRAAGYGRWVDLLERGETIHGLTRDFPPIERRLVESVGAESLAVVPVFLAEESWGSVGFTASVERTWTAAELDVLRTAADTLGAALRRRKVEREAARQLERLAGLRAITSAITASLDLSVTLDVILDHATARLGVAAADVLLLRPHLNELEFAAGRGLQTPALRHTRLALGEGLAGRVAAERRAVTVEELDRAPGEFRRAPLLMEEAFTAYHAIPLLSKGQVQGVLELFHRAPLEMDSEWLDYADTLGSQAAVAIDNALLFDELQSSNTDLKLAYDRTLEGWSRALDLRDQETEGHTRRVTEVTLRLARAMGVSDEELVHMRRGALLHDIGKMAIPDRILFKEGPLNEEETEVMRQHPVHALELLSPIDYLRPALDIPYAHHEKWDGSGYPRGLSGETIPRAARIFAVVDVWDALRSDRPYRDAWSSDRVREYLREKAGSHFDPEVVRVFLEEVLSGVEAAAAARGAGGAQAGGGTGRRAQMRTIWSFSE